MRVVLDTNILVRATKKSRGPAREVLLLIWSRGHTIVLSPFILRELRRVFKYPHLRAPLVKEYCAQYRIKIMTDLELLHYLHKA